MAQIIPFPGWITLFPVTKNVLEVGKDGKYFVKEVF